MHILIAPNAFKNALNADLAAAAIRRGLSRSRLPATSETFPVGDGGDGTGDLLIRQFGGEKIPAVARDPFGKKIDTYWGLAVAAPPSAIIASTAIIEMANASGLRLLDARSLDPLHASSAGTGDLIRAALERGAERLIVCMGGSATVDGGTGILQSLGARFLDGGGEPLKALPADLAMLDRIDLSEIDPRLAATDIVVVCDVENPLLGPEGAAAVFGPQKGASPEAIVRLEAGLGQFAKVIARQTGKDVASMPRGGTAGGAAAGLHGLLSAHLISGIDYYLAMTGFDRALERSTLVMTGEGKIDHQTFAGKAPYGVALRARARGIPVIAFTGCGPADPDSVHLCFDQVIGINPPAIGLEEALRNTAANLEKAAMAWADRRAGRR